VELGGLVDEAGCDVLVFVYAVLCEGEFEVVLV
jgi:hypothetical protein